MKSYFKKSIALILLGYSVSISFMIKAEESEWPLEKAEVDLGDLPSLQRGAQLFVNYCSGCHSLKYVRYTTLAQDIGIVDAKGQVLETLLKKTLMFSAEKPTDTLQSALTQETGTAWFGVPPPDLSLVSRSRGADWIYTYLRSFYLDPKKPWGVNNTLFPDVAMPDALYPLKMRFSKEPDGKEKWDRAVLDIVNFLSYAGEPMQQTRKKIGPWVLLFLSIFFVFAWLLKREYWKAIE